MSRYEFSLLQEVLLEKGSGVLGDFRAINGRIGLKNGHILLPYSILWFGMPSRTSYPQNQKRNWIGSKVSSIWQTSFFSKRGACKCIFRRMI